MCFSFLDIRLLDVFVLLYMLIIQIDLKLLFNFTLQPREEMNFTGKYKTGEQMLRLTNERFAVPEMLFHPSDIGIQEMGIPEAIVNSISKMPEGRVGLCYVSPLCDIRL